MTRRRASGWLKTRLLELIAETGRPMSGTQLAQSLQERGDFVHQSAVFRALEALRTAGAVRRIECLSAYVIASGADQIDCLCRKCGRLASVSVGSPAESLRQLAVTHAFVPGHVVLELIGVCEHCASVRQAAPSLT